MPTITINYEIKNRKAFENGNAKQVVIQVTLPDGSRFTHNIPSGILQGLSQSEAEAEIEKHLANAVHGRMNESPSTLPTDGSFDMDT